jgi:hypothetical protein
LNWSEIFNSALEDLTTFLRSLETVGMSSGAIFPSSKGAIFSGSSSSVTASIIFFLFCSFTTWTISSGEIPDYICSLMI